MRRKSLGKPDAWIEQELPQSEQCLRELRQIRDRPATYTGISEFFDFGLTNGGPGEPFEERLECLVRAGIWHVIALKTEFRLKLLHTIDGYLAAVTAQNPVSCFLLARYLLELVATVNTVRLMFDECLDIDPKKWKQRAIIFIVWAFRARHSTTDEGAKSIFAENGVPDSFVRPIKISKAIKRLASEPDFGWAALQYGRLSNICHQNGSARYMLVQSSRAGRVIRTSDGRRFFLKEKAPVFAVQYPAARSSSMALAMTARLAWYSAKRSNEMLEELIGAPFTDEEIAVISKGRFTTVNSCFVAREVSKGVSEGSKNLDLRRNDPCHCGSGKKFKHCCQRKPETVTAQQHGRDGAL